MANTQAAFEAINSEQIVTATDRLLLGTLKRYEPKFFALGTSPGFVIEEPTLCVRTKPAPSLRSSVVILGVAATVTWLAVIMICLLT